MSQPIAVGTLVMVTRTGTGLDGATGTVIGPLETRLGVGVFSKKMQIATGYLVRMARLTPWGSDIRIKPEFLVPILPPDTDTSTTRDTPVQTELVPV
jgi:hypothetical protein